MMNADQLRSWIFNHDRQIPEGNRRKILESLLYATEEMDFD